MEGYPWLWHDFQPDTSDGHARDADGKVLDPHGTGIRGYVVNNCRNISFEDLLLLRSAYMDRVRYRHRQFLHPQPQDRQPQAAVP